MLNHSSWWYDRFNGCDAYQTTIPLVFSDLLPQTVQLQLVDLQVRPDDKNNIHCYSILKGILPHFASSPIAMIPIVVAVCSLSFIISTCCFDIHGAEMQAAQ